MTITCRPLTLDSQFIKFLIPSRTSILPRIHLESQSWAYRSSMIFTSENFRSNGSRIHIFAEFSPSLRRNEVTSQCSHEPCQQENNVRKHNGNPLLVFRSIHFVYGSFTAFWMQPLEWLDVTRCDQTLLEFPSSDGRHPKDGEGVL